MEETEEPVGEASGIFFANIINCPINSVERGVYALNQDERHPGDYSAYNREYTMDLDAYESREMIGSGGIPPTPSTDWVSK